MGDIIKHFQSLSLEDGQKVINIILILEIEQMREADKLNILDLDTGEFGSYADVLYPWPFRYTATILADAVAGICRRDWQLYSYIVLVSQLMPGAAELENPPTANIADVFHWLKIIRCLALRNLINKRNLMISEATDVLAGFNSKINQITQYGYYFLCRQRGKLNDITFLMTLTNEQLSSLETSFINF